MTDKSNHGDAGVSAQGSEPSPKELWCDHGNATSMSFSTCTMTPECAARNAPRPVVCDCCGNVLIGVDGHFAEGHAKGCDLANEPSVSTGEVEAKDVVHSLLMGQGNFSCKCGAKMPGTNNWAPSNGRNWYIGHLEQTIADQKKRIAELQNERDAANMTCDQLAPTIMAFSRSLELSATLICKWCAKGFPRAKIEGGYRHGAPLCGQPCTASAVWNILDGTPLPAPPAAEQA